MRRLLLLAVLGAASLLPAVASAQTPTPVTVATPAADTGQVRQNLTAQNGGFAYQNPVIFENGTQVGKTGDGASLLTFVARGTCTVDPSSSLGDGAETIVSCAVTGAASGDFVIGAIETTSDVTDVYIKRAKAQTNAVHFSLGSYTAAQNPGDLVIRYLVVR